LSFGKLKIWLRAYLSRSEANGTLILAVRDKLTRLLPTLD